jgi:hypothetical protein
MSAGEDRILLRRNRDLRRKTGLRRSSIERLSLSVKHGSGLAALLETQ